MATSWLSSPLSLATALFGVTGRLNIRLVIAIGVTGLFQVALVVSGSYFDNAWYLPGAGRGLFQHYAAWAVRTPLGAAALR